MRDYMPSARLVNMVAYFPGSSIYVCNVSLLFYEKLAKYSDPTYAL